MKKTALSAILCTLVAASLSLGMGSHGQYDEEARAIERQEKQAKKMSAESSAHPIKNVATGVKQATYDSAKGLVKETAEGTKEETPVIGTIEGVRQGAGKALDSSIKGVAKVATLGMAEDEYKVEEPEHGSGEPTKVKFNF